jgi:hypothetical protein
MAVITIVHGIGQQHTGPHRLLAEWEPALLDGLVLAGVGIDHVELACAFYGDLFRHPGTTLALGDPPYDAGDVTEPWEVALLQAWWREAAVVDPGVVGPDEQVMLQGSRSVQRALDALSGSKFFAGVAERVLISHLKQAWAYFHDESLRAAMIGRVADAITSDTRVLIGHSFGSVVAYEALCAHPRWRCKF